MNDGFLYPGPGGRPPAFAGAGAADAEESGTRFASYFLLYMSILLYGYALVGKGFAYIGYPPVFVGEIGFLFALVVTIRHPLIRLWRSRIVWLLVLFVLWCAVFATAPYVGEYGLESLRDAAQWGYALYAIGVATALLKTDALHYVTEWYGKFARILLLVILPCFVAVTFWSAAIPRFPWGEYSGESGIPVILIKSGDVGVHLAGISIFMALNLAGGRLKSWLWSALWVVTSMAMAIGARAALVSIGIPVFLVSMLRPTSRWYRYIAIVLAFLAIFSLFDIEVDHGRRPYSVETLLKGAESIFEGTDYADFRGTKRWRLEWWKTILDYTVVSGDYFWFGKGFGVNLAVSDGFAPWDATLRSPHNGHLTILARSGVPGFALWVALQLSFAIALLRAFLADRRAGLRERADFSLWILLYWLAFTINASFDVYLEGPQGGIWFWSVFGLGLAHLIHRRAADDAVRPGTGMPRYSPPAPVSRASARPP